MNSLIEKLRAGVLVGELPNVERYAAEALMREAADEIERLERDAAWWRATGQTEIGRLDKLERYLHTLPGSFAEHSDTFNLRSRFNVNTDASGPTLREAIDKLP